MCGIAGTVGSGLTETDFTTLFAAVAHRGPSGSGVFRNDTTRLGMHRLHLRGGPARLPARDAGYVVAFNGQDYDAVGLAAEAASIRRGDPLDGMYAAAVYRDQRLVLRTDPQLIKPLFYRQLPEGTAFCSELRPLLNMARPTCEIDPEALTELFCYGWYLSDRTYAKDVRLVDCGPIVLDRVGSASSETQPAPHPAPRSRPPTPTDVRRAVAASVRRCVSGSGPFGLALSGGLDSSILAWELNAAGVEDLVTISVHSAEDPGITSLDELALPPRGAWTTWKHRSARMDDPADFFAEFEASIDAFAQPSTMSSLPLYRRLAAVAADSGVRVLLCGEGADEVFGGYHSYRGVSDLRHYYHRSDRLRLVTRLLGEAAVAGARRRFEARYGAASELRTVERKLRLARLLLRTDVCLMERTIEGRTPFLHGGVPELALAHPWDLATAAPGKTALRAAYQDALGARATAPKSRFKISDAVLGYVLSKPDVRARIELSQPGATDLLDRGFNADVACLVLSLAFLRERGLVT